MSTIGLLIVTLVSAALAAVMSVIAWRVARDERRRAEARIAALAAEINAEPVEAAIAPPVVVAAHRPAIDVSPGDLPLRDRTTPGPVTERERFVTPAASRFRFATVAGIGLFVVSSVGALAVLLSPGAETAPRGPIAADAPERAAEAPPLELLALGHDRVGDRLTVRGVVRNPAAGPAVDRLAAVVLVFNRDGEFVVSARAPVQASALAPGDESTFVVAIPDASDVSRYRVSFRADERVLAHVDKRELAAVARMQ